MTELKKAAITGQTDGGLISPGAVSRETIQHSTRPKNPVIAFYLPQFHPIPENDRFWGKGFTEWHNVSSAKPQYKGHYQPHIPADLGFYDLRLPEIRNAQAELAKQYGLGGFCYHHYWFHGRRVLERPFQDVLQSGEPDFPFCLNWANENWTRRWDGGDKSVLIDQRYSDEDSAAHIRSLYPAFNDKRYIRLNDRPLFLIYNLASIPDPRRVTDVMRNTMAKDGMGELHLCAAETFAGRIDPRPFGMDSAVEFPPHHCWRLGIESDWRRFDFNDSFRGSLNDYRMLIHDELLRETPTFPLFRTVVPGWDNTARRGVDATVLVNSTPELYGEWLYHMIEWTKRAHPNSDAPVFVNAWNEWAEGCHLEPDQAYGLSHLEATREAVARSNIGSGDAEYAALVQRDQFWLKFMSRRGLGWPAADPEAPLEPPPPDLSKISITRFLHQWFVNDRARIPPLRRALAPFARPLLRFMSHDRLE